MKKALVVLLSCVTLALAAVGCGGAKLNLQPVVTDIANIATVVIADVLAGKPFMTVLSDTGSADAQFLVDVITVIESDPNLTPAVSAQYKLACASYLTQAKSMAALQHPIAPSPDK